MDDMKADIIVLGATGFTGKLITRYLSLHPQHTQGLFTFAVAARSQSKLHTLVQELSLPPAIKTIRVDATSNSELENVIKSAKVIINTVGPYWRWGTPVVSACVRNGVHYVDLTGETVWIKSIIEKFDYLATKTGAIIVPSCGLDSMPSDILAFLSNKTLKAYGDYDVENSTTAHKIRGGVSGGTLNTAMTIFEEVPKDKLKESGVDYSLSPVKGRKRKPFSFLYELPIPDARTIIGGFFFMQPTNKALVQRTFGLLELQALSTNTRVDSNSLAVVHKERYGPSFSYDEFVVLPSRLSAVMVSTAFAIGFGMLALVTPLRWLVKKLMPAPGSGPSDEYMAKGFIRSTNITTSTSSPPVQVKTTLKGDGDPGYLLTAVMISEAALSCILPPASETSSTSQRQLGKLPAGLPDLARKGGILTPMTAFGSVLVTRLSETGRFEFESQVVGRGLPEENRKDI